MTPPIARSGFARGVEQNRNLKIMNDKTTETSDLITDAFAKVGSSFLRAGNHRFPFDELQDYRLVNNPRDTDLWYVELTYRTLSDIKRIEVSFDSQLEAKEAASQLDALVAEQWEEKRW